jgi:hypothetical protein
MLIEPKQQYRNFKDEIHEVTIVSPAGNVLYAKNIDTCVIEKFTYYTASGLYIKNGTQSVELGTLIINK